VVHRVVAVLERNLLVVDPIGLGDGRERLGIAADADQARIEARQVLLELLRRVPLRIDRDEQRIDLLGVGPELAEDLGDVEQGGRTDFRAMREAEKHQERAALQILIGDHLAVLIGQLERAADGGDLLRHRGRQAPGHDQNDPEAKHNEAAWRKYFPEFYEWIIGN